MNENKKSDEVKNEKLINAESLNIEATLDEVSQLLKSNETLILDIGNNYYHQADVIFDKLILKGYDVKKSFTNGRNQVIVRKKENLH